MNAKQEHIGLRLYALEDGEDNFAGAVCIHDPSGDPGYTWNNLIGPFDLIASPDLDMVNPTSHYRLKPRTLEQQSLSHKPTL